MIYFKEITNTVLFSSLHIKGMNHQDNLSLLKSILITGMRQGVSDFLTVKLPYTPSLCCSFNESHRNPTAGECRDLVNLIQGRESAKQRRTWYRFLFYLSISEQFFNLSILEQFKSLFYD